MRLGTMVEDMMGYFKEDGPIIHVQTEIMPDDPEVLEVYIKLQNKPAYTPNNGMVEILKNSYAYHAYGEDGMVWMGADDDGLFYFGFHFKPTVGD